MCADSGEHQYFGQAVRAKGVGKRRSALGSRSQARVWRIALTLAGRQQVCVWETINNSSAELTVLGVEGRLKGLRWLGWY